MSRAPPVRASKPSAGTVQVLHPAEVVYADQGDRLETLLGSCVAIMLTDPRRRVGVMCHSVHRRPASSAARANRAAVGVPVWFDDVGGNPYRRPVRTVGPDRPPVTAVAV